MSVILPGNIPGAGRAPCTSTCGPWATEADVTWPHANVATDTLEQALQMASDILFFLSGRQYPGSCEDVVRPCARPLGEDRGRPIRGWYGGLWLGGQYSAWGWCDCNSADRSGAHRVAEIGLGAFPVTGIVEVLEDGAPLDPASYRIDDNQYLVRLGDPAAGNAPRGWPCRQRLDLPPDQPGTWQVTFIYGTPPPPGGVVAAAVLGWQIALGLTPATVGECRLPKRTTSITRQGISAVVLDPQAYIKEGRTGLTEVDTWLHSVNPAGIARPATVSHPDLRRRSVRRTGA